VRTFLAAPPQLLSAARRQRRQAGALARRLRRDAGRIAERHGLEVQLGAPELMLGAVRWHSVHHRRVYISQLSIAPARTFQLAVQLAHLEAQDEVDAVLGEARFTSDNAVQLARRTLNSYWAAALIMPYREFAARCAQAPARHRSARRAFGRQLRAAAHPPDHAAEARRGRRAVLLPAHRSRRQRLEAPRWRGLPVRTPRRRLPAVERPFMLFHAGEIVTQRSSCPTGSATSRSRALSAQAAARSVRRGRSAQCAGLCAEHAGQLVYADGPRPSRPRSSAAPATCAIARLRRARAPPIGSSMRPDRYREAGAPFAFAGE
jgi:predicted transcriptional regulator